MQPQEAIEERVRAAAKRGASGVTSSGQVIADAVDEAVRRWENAEMEKRTIGNWEGWSFRIGANAARKLQRKWLATQSDAKTLKGPSSARQIAWELSADEGLSDFRSRTASQRRILRAHLARKKNLLRGRQYEVVLKMLEPGMSYHRAAKDLGMERSNVRRSFRSALERISLRSK